MALRSLLVAGLLADVELKLPAVLVVAAVAPQLERADLGHLAVQVDRHHAALLAGRLQRRRHRRQLVDLALPVLDQGADGVAPADGRAEEAELGRLADDEAEL